MRAQMDGLQLQVQLVAEKSGNNHVSTATLEHMAQCLEQGLKGLTARVDGLAAAGIGAGHVAALRASSSREAGEAQTVQWANGGSSGAGCLHICMQAVFPARTYNS